MLNDILQQVCVCGVHVMRQHLSIQMMMAGAKEHTPGPCCHLHPGSGTCQLSDTNDRSQPSHGAYPCTQVQANRQARKLEKERDASALLLGIERTGEAAGNHVCADKWLS